MAKRKELTGEKNKSKGIVINKGMFFLPDDLKKLKLKGKWMLYIKKGVLIKLE